jgi:hypothetical protein
VPPIPILHTLIATGAYRSLQSSGKRSSNPLPRPAEASFGALCSLCFSDEMNEPAEATTVPFLFFTHLVRADTTDPHDCVKCEKQFFDATDRGALLNDENIPQTKTFRF